MKNKIIALCMVMAALLAVPAFADLTMDEKLQVNMGSKKMVIYKMDLYGNYDANNGQVIDFTTLGFVHVDSVDIMPRRGNTFDYNYDESIVRIWTGSSEFSHGTSMATLTDIKVKVIGY